MDRKPVAFGMAVGLVAGVAFVLTCTNGSDVTSRLFAVNEAQASDANNCNQWEVVHFKEATMAVTGEVLSTDRNHEYCTENALCPIVGLAPAGWEVLGFDGTHEDWILRRCVD